MSKGPFTPIKLAAKMTMKLFLAETAALLALAS
jgi:hypothetical protein